MPPGEEGLRWNLLAVDLPKIDRPILAVYGGNDDRVIADHGWKALLRTLAGQSAVSSLDVTVRVLPGTNHFLTDREHALKGEMMPGVTDFLSGWILEKAGYSSRPTWNRRQMASRAFRRDR